MLLNEWAAAMWNNVHWQKRIIEAEITRLITGESLNAIQNCLIFSFFFYSLRANEAFEIVIIFRCALRNSTSVFLRQNNEPSGEGLLRDSLNFSPFMPPRTHQTFLFHLNFNTSITRHALYPLELTTKKLCGGNVKEQKIISQLLSVGAVGTICAWAQHQRTCLLRRLVLAFGCKKNNTHRYCPMKTSHISC